MSAIEVLRMARESGIHLGVAGSDLIYLQCKGREP